jgi:serine/threonine-protein phosphatase 2B catalytic subunit
MLVAVLNCCTKEELDEGDEEDEAFMASPGVTSASESAERRKIIKNKILAVGRISRVFSLLR